MFLLWGSPWVTHVAGATLRVVGTWVLPMYLVPRKTTTKVKVTKNNPPARTFPQTLAIELFRLTNQHDEDMCARATCA